MERAGALLVVGLALALLVTSACDPEGAPGPVRPEWRPAALPFPPGPPGRIALRDVTTCDGHWYVVGAVLGADGSSRPAAWHSDDGRTFTTMTLEPVDYWARRAILYSVACRHGRAAALGARSGGAHGNPRVTSWHQRADGTLADARAAFELFGGPEAVSVSRLSAGLLGWLIAGSRTSGASVWLSADATDFRLHDEAPGLATGDASTAALDAVGGEDGWTVVGRSRRPGRVAPVPAAWASPDGRAWEPQEVDPGSDAFAELQRVVRSGEALVGAGLRGDRFGLWRQSAGRWTAEPGFGRVTRTTGRAFVSGLSGVGEDDLLVSVSDGSRFGLWVHDGRWREVHVPLRPRTSGDHQLSVAGDGAAALLVADDGRAGRAWWTRWAG